MRRHLRLQTACRLYLYGNVLKFTDLARQTGSSVRTIREVRISDGWDRFAEQIWAEQNTGAAGLAIRRPEEQALIDNEIERQRGEIDLLQRHAKLQLEALGKTLPGTKAELALINAMTKTRELLEGSTRLDLAIYEAKMRVQHFTKRQAWEDSSPNDKAPKPPPPALGDEKPKLTPGRIVDIDIVARNAAAK